MHLWRCFSSRRERLSTSVDVSVTVLAQSWALAQILPTTRGICEGKAVAAAWWLDPEHYDERLHSLTPSLGEAI